MKRVFLGASALMVALPAMAQVPATTPMAPGKERIQTRDEAVAKVRVHFAQMDANRDGFIAGDEMKLADRRHGQSPEMRKERRERAAFEFLDRNRDNSISREEYSSFREARGERMGGRSAAPVAMSGDRPRMAGGGGWGGPGKGSLMMRVADLDRDGKVSLQEATTSALQRFDRVDANRDGQITPEERQERRQMRQQKRGSRAG